MKIKELYEKKVTKKQFLEIVGAFILGLVIVPRRVLAKLLFRKEDGSIYDIDDFLTDANIVGVGTTKITVSSSEPGTPSEGDIWLDTS